MGPLKMLGMVFNTVGTVINVADNTVTRTSNLINDGFDMLDTAVAGAKQDFATDQIVDDATRKVAVKRAQAKSTLLIAKLEQ